jgi:hypothetical protein
MDTAPPIKILLKILSLALPYVLGKFGVYLLKNVWTEDNIFICLI